MYNGCFFNNNVYFSENVLIINIIQMMKNNKSLIISQVC
jgi:hypothetical protein